MNSKGNKEIEKCKETAKGIYDGGLQALAGVAVLVGFGALIGLGFLCAACDVTESIMNDAWDCFNYVFQDN